MLAGTPDEPNVVADAEVENDGDDVDVAVVEMVGEYRSAPLIELEVIGLREDWPMYQVVHVVYLYGSTYLRATRVERFYRLAEFRT